MTEYREECPICGDEHDANLHGDALVIRDWSVRDLDSMTSVAVVDAMDILADREEYAPSFQKLCNLYDGYQALDDLTDDSADDERESRDETLVGMLDSIEAILSDAGYFAYSDGDAGCWFVFGPARDPSARIIGATS